MNEKVSVLQVDNLSVSSDSGSENDFKSLGKVDSKTILTLYTIQH